MSNIKLDPKTIETVAILSHLDQNARDILIQQAIENLLKVDPRYNSTPLQEAFSSAMRSVTYEVCRKMISDNDEIKNKIKDLISDAVIRVIETKEEAIQKIANGFVNSMCCHD